MKIMIMKHFWYFIIREFCGLCITETEMLHQRKITSVEFNRVILLILLFLLYSLLNAHIQQNYLTLSLIFELIIQKC